jgi:hypothetical protein
VSHSELQFNNTAKVSDSVCKMMCCVDASQMQINCVHVDMLPCVWINIKAFIIEKTAIVKYRIFVDKDVSATTIKHGIFITTDQ